jgi:hypothetical protein
VLAVDSNERVSPVIFDPARNWTIVLQPKLGPWMFWISKHSRFEARDEQLEAHIVVMVFGLGFVIRTITNEKI